MPPTIQGDLAQDHILQALTLDDLRLQTLFLFLNCSEFPTEALELATEQEMLSTGSDKSLVMGDATVATLPLVEPAWAAKLTELVQAMSKRSLVCYQGEKYDEKCKT